MKYRCRALTVLLFGCMTLNVSAEIYKCTDLQGKTRYSDKPCGGKETVITPRTGPATSSAAQTAEERQQKTRRLLDAYQADREQKKQAEVTARKIKAERRKKCLWARDYYRNVQAAGRVYGLDADGNRVIMNDAVRATETARAKAEVERWCK